MKYSVAPANNFQLPRVRGRPLLRHHAHDRRNYGFSDRHCVSTIAGVTRQTDALLRIRQTKYCERSPVIQQQSLTPSNNSLQLPASAATACAGEITAPPRQTDVVVRIRHMKYSVALGNNFQLPRVRDRPVLRRHAHDRRNYGFSDRHCILKISGVTHANRCGCQNSADEILRSSS